MSVELNSQQSWLRAKEIVDQIGQVPSFLSASLRMIRLDFERGGSELNRSSRQYLETLLRGSSLRVPLMYAANTFYPGRLPDTAIPSVESLTNVFNAEEWVATVGILYYFRRLQRLCEPGEWKPIRLQIERESEIGGHVGCALDRIGLATGLITGAASHLAMAMFLSMDVDLYLRYKSRILSSNLQYDLHEETLVWGCNHLQLLAMMLVSFGVAAQAAESFSRGMYRQYAEIGNLPEQAGAVTAAATWIKSLSNTGRAPEITHRGEFYPLERQMQDLLLRVRPVRDQGTLYGWLDKGRKDHPDYVPNRPSQVGNSEEVSEDPNDLFEHLSHQDVRLLSKADL